MREAYDIAYQIYDHAAELPDPRPLALVAMHPKENVSEHSALYNEIRRFDSHDMAKHGYSLTEFLNMPQEYARLLLRIRAQRASRDLNKVRNAMDEVEKDLQ